MSRRIRTVVVSLSLVGGLLAQAPGQAQDLEWTPHWSRGLTVPTGFVARVFAQSTNVPTTLEWGPDTGGELRHGAYLYVGGITGNPTSCSDCGTVVAISDEGNQHTAASGLQSVLGLTFGPDNTMWVADNLDNRGRILALRDTDGDAVFETRRVVLKNIPNGRHQTNGMTFGPDGMLYVANGNATDNGIDCGPPLGPQDPVGLPEPIKSFYEDNFRNIECAVPELEPWTGSIIRVDPTWEDVDLLADVRVDPDPFYAEDGMDDETVLVAEGFRNIYDVQFNPRKPNEIWTPMNGPDNPSGSEPLYGFEVDNEQIVGFDAETNEPIYGPIIEDAGFPSCIYDGHNNIFPNPSIGGHDHDGDPVPGETPHGGVVEKFGPCVPEEIMWPRDVLNEGHEGTAGLAFERGDNFPAKYEGDLFIAEWGSLWNLNGLPGPGAVFNGWGPTGHKVIHLDMDADNNVIRERVFMSGVLPMDITFNEDGYMYVADMSGQIYEIQSVVDPGQDAAVVVEMRQGQFVPQTLPILRGQTVTWRNFGETAYDITAQPSIRLVEPTNNVFTPSEMNSGPIPPGGTHSFTFDIPGVYHYWSEAGGNAMRGTIVVTTQET